MRCDRVLQIGYHRRRAHRPRSIGAGR
jgi:hypothetical protein